MKLLSPLLAASLVANAALLAALVLRYSPAPASPDVAEAATLAVANAASVAAGKKTEALLAALNAGDASAMAAAGVSPEVIRYLAAARAFGKLAAVARETGELPARKAGVDYWRNTRNVGPRPPPTREQRAARTAAEREFETAMKAAFGEDPFGNDDGSRYGFLPTTKQEKLRQIERDYDEMRQELSFDSEGVQLRTDKEKLRLLDAEKERDLAAVLSPAEREQLELRSSPSAREIINRYGDAIANEDEYKRLYALQQAFDSVYSSEDYRSRPHTPEENRAREAAQRQLNDDLRAALGDDRWGAVSSANDWDHRTLNTLTTRLGLPAATPDQVFALRDTYAAQSAAINQNTALTAAQRRAQLADLATRAKADLRAKLGPDGADAYRPNWIQMMQNGTAFTTDARQLPAGSPRPGVGGSGVIPLPAPQPPASQKP